MLIDGVNVFDKENIDEYLNKLSKEYKKIAGRNNPAELVLIGGAAVLENYSFRDMTKDIDAIILASSAMKEAANRVGDRENLPNDWLNMDFKFTGSYSEKIVQYSQFHKTFNQVLDVRVISGEYLIAMKLRAMRKYKNDLSDVFGILAEHEKNGDIITFERIDKAVTDLYGSWKDFSPEAIELIKGALAKGNYMEQYKAYRKFEIETKEKLDEFRKKNKGSIKRGKVNELVDSLLKKREEDDLER